MSILKGFHRHKWAFYNLPRLNWKAPASARKCQKCGITEIYVDTEWLDLRSYRFSEDARLPPCYQKYGVLPPQQHAL